MAMTVAGSREAREKWRNLLDAVFTGAGDVVIERNGQRIATISPMPITKQSSMSWTISAPYGERL